VSGIIRAFVAERWRWGILLAKATLQDVVKALNFRLGKLGETLNFVQDRVEDGPVPGAYFPIVLYCDTPTIQDQIAITYTPQEAQGLRLISCSISLSEQSDASADLDAEVEFFDPVALSWSSILTTTPQTPTETTAVQLNSAGDFTQSYYSASAFRVNCTDLTNIPKGLMVLLSCKNMGKIEPA
jgi:hypothetical protein